MTQVQDKLERERFTRKYQEMHRLVREPDATTVLYIGAENWPFPIPLVSTNGAWQFDAEAGMQEVLFRRIGENEVTAIQACHALVAAEKERKRATAIRSTQAIRALLVNAGDDGPVVPFHGYYFRILANQGKSAATGAARQVRPQDVRQPIRICGLSRGVPVNGRDDLRCQPGRRCVRKGPWPEHRAGCEGHDQVPTAIRPGIRLSRESASSA